MGVYRVSPTCARRVRDSGRGGCTSRRSGEYYAGTKEGSKGNNRFYLWHVASDVSRWLSYALVIWFIFLPRFALAEPVVEVSNFAGYEDGETYTGYVVCDSPNAYTSSIVLIGEYAKLIQVDSVMYAKLSDPVKGGAFYALTQKWQHIGTNGSGSVSNYPSWLAMSRDFADGLNVVYGYDRNWSCVVTTTEVADALRDFNKILEGEDVGGDDDEPSNPDDAPNDGSYYYIKWTEQLTDDNEDVVGFAISKTIYQGMLNLWANDSDIGLYVIMSNTKTSNDKYRSYVMGVEDKPVISDSGVTVTGNYTDVYTYNGGGELKTYNNEKYLYVPARTQIYTSAVKVSAGTNYNAGRPYGAYYFSKEGSGSGGGGTTPDPDPVDPPEDPLPTQPDPTAPEPPNLPDPTDRWPVQPDVPETPAGPDVEPEPTVVVPTAPVNTPEPTNTSPTDYTPWLRAILLQLQVIADYFADFAGWLGDELASHCLHIRQHMTDCVTGFEEYFGGQLYWFNENIASNMSYQSNWTRQHMTDLLEEHHDYLEELAQWVVDNLRWEGTAGEYDDSNVLYWLKRIWAKQGNGTVNTRPSDPVTNYNIYVTWLGDLFGDIAVDLGGLDLSSLMQALEGLSDVFPFSIPWNVIAVFGLLSANAVTPSFDFTIPATDYFGTYSYEIDMQWLDGAMASVRAIELLAFVCYVLVHTKDICGFLLGGDD